MKNMPPMNQTAGAAPSIPPAPPAAPSAPSAPSAQAAPAIGGQVDVPALVAQVEAKIPANLKDIYNKAVLSGMRIMFSGQSHHLLTDALDKPGPLATNISNGIIQLMYLLWTQSNKTLPPQIIVPVTVTLTLKAFDYLQHSHDPQATKDVLGQATTLAIHGIMARFGVGQAPQAGAQPPSGGATPPPGGPSAPPGAGMLDTAGGQ
jgi:hypothetical protein